MTNLYAVRLSDGSFMQGRKPQFDEGGFLVWDDPAKAGNAVIARKAAGKLPEDAEYEVVRLGYSEVTAAEDKERQFLWAVSPVFADEHSMHEPNDEEKTQA